MNAVDHFEIDGSIGIKNEPGKLCLAKRKVTKGRGNVQHELTEFFIYTVVYSRLNNRPAKIKVRFFCDIILNDATITGCNMFPLFEH
jgi:hypothetical protein